jgi:hypothetical protein
VDRAAAPRAGCRIGASLPRQSLAERRLDQGRIVDALTALVRDVTSVGIFVGLRLEGGL